ncbi:hypothetical protein HYDPIDRAFT_101556, partial [Hydnomerulius pinastri MD-312]
TSSYTLELPLEMRECRIHPTFHISLLRKHEANNNTLCLKREASTFYDVGTSEETEWVVDKILAHQWEGQAMSFLIKWNLGDTSWEPYNNCKELEALDEYLELAGVKSWRQLPRRLTPHVPRKR